MSFNVTDEILYSKDYTYTLCKDIILYVLFSISYRFSQILDAQKHTMKINIYMVLIYSISKYIYIYI